jgi:hypothetical protein
VDHERNGSPLAVIAIVVIFCAGPLCVFWKTLRELAVAESFNMGPWRLAWAAKSSNSGWGTRAIRQTMPSRCRISPPRSTFIPLSPTYNKQTVPIGVRSNCRLAGAALARAIPLALIVFPLDLIVKEVLRFLL